jgi:hypothetical protein
MVERRDKTTTEGRGLGHSWADDNVERGSPDVDYVKRRPQYTFGDNPRGREIDFQDTSGDEAYGSTRNQVFRAYRGKAPIEGQEFGMPEKKGKIFQKVKELRPELPDRSTADSANASLQAGQAGILTATNFTALFPSPTISSPAPGATFSPGNEITVVAPTTALRDIHSATLEIDGQAVARRVIDRRDQDSTTAFDFRFIYKVPDNRALGPMTITIRAFNVESALQGIVLDDALGTTSKQGALGTLQGGRATSATSSSAYQTKFPETGFLRSPEGVVSITVNIV